MIKMPIRLDARETPDWRECLRRAWEQTQDLQRTADDLRDNSLRYIRPILLVQTERTGNRNADDGTVHALDAKELLLSLGVEPEAIKLKTADTNEIEGVDLLSPSCPVRVIITKSALQEGWDCPFAYVLCSLTPAKSLSGMTQLIGRILRQPQAQKTGVAALDRCYVFTSFSSTQAVFKAIKDGLEGEGMGDLAGRVQLADGGAGNSQTLVRERRAEFRNLDYFLPTVCFRESDNSVRALDWESDILAKVDWSHISLAKNAKSTYLNLQHDYRRTVDVGLEIIKGARPIDIDGGVIEREEFDLVYAVRVLNKQIPNPFIAARLIQEFLAVLPSNGFKPKDVATQQRYLVEQMQIAATAAVEVACREVFEQGLRDHRILFNLKTASGAWQVPHTSETTPGKIESRADGKAFQFDLFEPTYAEELNGLEYKLASYADRSNAIDWWYRNVVRGDGYGLQGWRKNRAYPDFILAQTRDEHRHWVVLETKGDQLSGNLDTNYKDELMQRLVAAYQDQQYLASVGELEILDGNETFDCRIILETGWESSVSAALAA
jgi:type III restriction enzyme